MYFFKMERKKNCQFILVTTVNFKTMAIAWFFKIKFIINKAEKATFSFFLCVNDQNIFKLK